MPTYTYAQVNALRSTFLEIMADVRRANPQAWADAHRTAAPRGDLFARLVAREGQLRGYTVGVNAKRGNLGDLSQDCINFPVESGGAIDASGKFPGLVIIDFISSAGTAAADLAWIDQTGPTIAQGTKGGFVLPVVSIEELATGGAVSGTPPVTPPAPPACKAHPCTYDASFHRRILSQLDDIEAQLGLNQRRQELLFDQQTKRLFGEGPGQELGIAGLVIDWLSKNSVRVRFR